MSLLAKCSIPVSVSGSNIRVGVSLHEFTERVSLVSSLSLLHGAQDAALFKSMPPQD